MKNTSSLKNLLISKILLNQINLISPMKIKNPFNLRNKAKLDTCNRLS
jgi:hypothetical protein